MPRNKVFSFFKSYSRCSLVILVMGFLIVFTSCTKEEARDFSRAERVLIDSLYKKEMGALRDSLDSICVAKYEGLLDYYVDSIKEKRMEEIKALLDEEK